MWVRGLKRYTYVCSKYHKRVAPYVGAWIETYEHADEERILKSHPMWVRGLKLVACD